MEKKKIFKVSCEYYLQGKDYNEVLDFIANEDNLVESHFIIDEVKVGSVDEDDIYNHPKFECECEWGGNKHECDKCAYGTEYHFDEKTGECIKNE